MRSGMGKYEAEISDDIHLTILMLLSPSTFFLCNICQQIRGKSSSMVITAIIQCKPTN